MYVWLYHESGDYMKRYIFLSILCVLFVSSLHFGMQQNNNENFFKNKDRMQPLINQINPGETWRHYKNKDYRIIAISCKHRRFNLVCCL